MVVSKLRKVGYSERDAEKLCCFVPSAFAWVILKRMGVESFPNVYIASDALGGDVEVQISAEHFFTAALDWAYSTLESGWDEHLPRSTFELIIQRSAEMGAANKALEAGTNLSGARMQPLRVYRFLAAEPDAG